MKECLIGHGGVKCCRNLLALLWNLQTSPSSLFFTQDGGNRFQISANVRGDIQQLVTIMTVPHVIT
jgi:hypothetical protein